MGRVGVFAMSLSLQSGALVGAFCVLSVLGALRWRVEERTALDSHLRYTWVFFLVFVVSEFISFRVGVWILAVVSFWALREYLSLVDLRAEDRVGMFGAYFSIPFMMYFIQDDWYGMFIVSIPVYVFLAIPLLVSLGGREARGAVFSIGALDFGLFLCVFCLGHLGYLLLFSTWKAVTLVVSVGVCDVLGWWVCGRVKGLWRRVGASYAASAPLTVVLVLGLSSWSEIPKGHAVVLGLLIPLLVVLGRHAGDYVKRDLGVPDDALPGRGGVLEGLRSFFYAAPVVFHYVRYYLT